MALAALWTAIRNHPVMTLQAAGIALVAALMVYLWVDYRSAKADLQDARAEISQLEATVKGERAARVAVRSRLDEFVAAQKLQAVRLEEMARQQAETRREVSNIVSGLSASEVRRLIEENPDEASAVLSRRVDDLFSLFDDATAP